MTTVTLPKTATTGPGYFDLDAVRDALATGAPVVFPPFEVVRAEVGGQPVTFCLNMTGFDPIQKQHRAGKFYEAPELAEIAGRLPQAAHILDVGANVGNHTLYFALFAGAARIVAVEPNPLALAPLMANILLNGIADRVETGALGVGLGAASQGGFGMRRARVNLGASKMRPGEGTLEVHAGDSLFEDERFDLIKIDVEGMELDVIAGLEQTIARCRPLLCVEVDDENVAAFETWAEARGYRSVGFWRRSKKNQNYLMAPGGADT